MKYLLILLCAMYTSPYSPSTGPQSGVYLSIDRGVNWTRADIGLPKDVQISTWITTDGIVIAGTDKHGIFLSTDHLKSWNPSSKGLPRDVRVLSLTSSRNLIFAGTYQKGIFYSDDRGESWHPANQGLGNSNIRSLYYLHHTLFAGTDAGLYLSIDEGKSWTLAIGHVQINGFSSLRNELFVASNKGVLRSADSGKTWNWIFEESAINKLSAHEKDIFLLDFEGNVYRSPNGSDVVWIQADVYLPFQYTFRLTQSGQQFFTADWKKSIKGLNNVNEFFWTNGISETVPITELLDTPYGILAGVGNPGC